jgi:hypothetical protein
MHCDECGAPLWRAGEIVPAGTYVRIDDPLHRVVILDQSGPLPAMFDGHIALYRAAPATCACTCTPQHLPGAVARSDQQDNSA